MLSPSDRALDWNLWRRWTLVTTAGECLGFAVPAAVGALAAPVLTGPRGSPGFAALMVGAGAVEGAVLGKSQWLVLVRRFPGFSGQAWITRTALAAALAWAIGMLPSTLYDMGVSTATIAAVAILLAPVLLCSIPVLQWTALRRFVARAGWWIPINAAAWLAGISLVFAAMVLVDERSPKEIVFAVGASGGLLMGATVAAISGLGLALAVGLRKPTNRLNAARGTHFLRPPGMQGAIRSSAASEAGGSSGPRAVSCPRGATAEDARSRQRSCSGGPGSRFRKVAP